MKRRNKNRIAVAALTLLTAGLCLPAWGQSSVQGKKIRIDLIGDSTQTDNAGYGRGFCANFTAEIDCVNMAKGGSSTMTFRRDGLWEKSLATHPDYMVIQFGHNDMVSPAHADREVPIDDYDKNLRNFIYDARQNKIKPILVTPLTRRYFGMDGKVHSDLTAYSERMKQVATALKVPLIDLQTESIAYLDSIGEAKGIELGITKKDNDGKTVPDKTHLNWEGSYVFGRMVAVDLGKAAPELAKYVLPKRAELPSEGVLAMKVYRGEPFKIVMVGDSTVALQGGWGPGFCAVLTPNVTCVDLALNGRSSKSFIDEGAWKKALDEKGQYYFIQFGHNDQKPDPSRHTDPQTTFKENLKKYIQESRAIGAIPVVFSPLTRRNYKDGKLAEDGLEQYQEAAKQVAAEEKVTFIDLLHLSRNLLQNMTQEQADIYNAGNHPDAAAENKSAAKPDRTHLNEKGKEVFGRLVADNLIRIQVELGPNVKGVPASAVPSTTHQAAPTDGH